MIFDAFLIKLRCNASLLHIFKFQSLFPHPIDGFRGLVDAQSASAVRLLKTSPVAVVLLAKQLEIVCWYVPAGYRVGIGGVYITFLMSV